MKSNDLRLQIGAPKKTRSIIIFDRHGNILKRKGEGTIPAMLAIVEV